MANAHLVLEAVPDGSFVIFGLGGGNGIFRSSLEGLGHRDINLDIRRVGTAEPSLIGDAHRLPFKDGIFGIVISKDSLHFFLNPWLVVKEVGRVLEENGRLIILVPFMHPFHGGDLYRYSPAGLRHLLGDFEFVRLDTPLVDVHRIRQCRC